MTVQTPTSSTIPLHRIRFYDQTPSPITCLAYPPTPLPAARDPSHKGKARAGSDELGVLVVARENGDVEIHQWARENEKSFGNWTCHRVLPPTLTHPSVSLMALVIRDPDNFHTKGYNVPKLEDLRLFTAGSDSTDLVERCLLTGRILSTYPIPSPPLWSISVSPTHKYICLATSSPTLHFLSIPSTPTPLEPPPSHLIRSDTLPSRTRTVSLAWGIPKLQKGEEGWEWRDTYIITGNSDSSFRKWEIPGASSSDGSRQGQGRVVLKSRAVVEKIGKIKGKRVGGKGTIVWGVGVLPDHTIVTSDSLGSVTFWDGASMAQKQHFQAHKADGMCLLIGPNGKTIFTSGPDQRVCQFTYIPSSSNFALTSTKRLHSHDVRALAITPSYSPIATSTSDLSPVLVSGGYDMSLTFTPAAAPSLMSEDLRNPLGKGGMSRCVFDEAFTRKMGYLTAGASRVGVSKGGRFVLGRKERSVGIWRVLRDEAGWEKVLEMDLRLRTNLISSAISEDGNYIAISDLYETKLFTLRSSETEVKAIRIKSFLNTLSTSKHTSQLDIASKGLGSSTLAFTPDSRRLVMGHVQSGNIIVVSLPSPNSGDGDGEGVEVIKSFQMGGNVVHGRVIAGGKKRRRNGRKNEIVEEVVEEEEDGMEVDSASADEDEEKEEVKEEETAIKGDEQSWISCLGASGDGQWLVSGDTAGRVTIFNLDTLQIHSSLPNLPTPPSALLFPPSSPSLLLILTPQTLTPYHIERRRLLPPNLNSQLSEINTALQGRYIPALGASFEPLPSSSTTSSNSVINKLVIWGNEFLLTARIDISDLNSRILSNKPFTPNNKHTRRKRAREARDALERSTTGSSERSTPLPLQHVEEGGMVKVHGGEVFRSIIGADWLGSGELVVVERPFSDFVGELPPAFVSASYGRS